MQLSLALDTPPEGFRYRPDFLARDEEQSIAGELAQLTLHQVIMHGQAAKRTVAHFGVNYGYDSRSIAEDAPFPAWLQSLAARVAPEMQLRADAIAEVLITHYPAGARIGWHRDAPMFGPAIAGLSLLGDCQLRFRRARKDDDDYDKFSTAIAPRSLYVLDGAARKIWQHMIPAVPAPRWSLTFRSLLSPDRRASRAVARRRGGG